MKNRIRFALLSVLPLLLLSCAQGSTKTSKSNSSSSEGNSTGVNPNGSGSSISSSDPGGSTRAIYTIAFETFGGSHIPAQNVVEGEIAKEPASPSREGYTFDNWHRYDTLNSPYHFDEPVTSDMTLYAKWNRLPYGKTRVYFCDTTSWNKSSATTAACAFFSKAEPHKMSPDQFNSQAKEMTHIGYSSSYDKNWFEVEVPSWATGVMFTRALVSSGTYGKRKAYGGARTEYLELPFTALGDENDSFSLDRTQPNANNSSGDWVATGSWGTYSGPRVYHADINYAAMKEGWYVVGSAKGDWSPKKAYENRYENGTGGIWYDIPFHAGETFCLVYATAGKADWTTAKRWSAVALSNKKFEDAGANEYGEHNIKCVVTDTYNIALQSNGSIYFGN